MTPTETLLRQAFPQMTVFKDLRTSNFFKDLKLPSFLRDWLLRRFEDGEGACDTDGLQQFVRTYLPRREQWTDVKNRLIVEGERVKLLARVSVDIGVGTGEVTFSLPDFGLGHGETTIEPGVWQRVCDELRGGHEAWGVVELAYRPPEPALRRKGRVKLTDYRGFRPYVVDPDLYREARRAFTTEQWVDVLLGAIDLQADGFDRSDSKLTLLQRLLPFAESNLNLLELAPKGTGKSYLFGAISRFGQLTTGRLTRAKLFYDMARRADGLVFHNDFLALDEVQRMPLDAPGELTQTLQNYMEQGTVLIGDRQARADCGIVLLGNIAVERQDASQSLLDDLPQALRESALVDRLHGFVEGWRIPRMNEGLKVRGWALNSEYFTSMLHLLRSDASYRALVDQVVRFPANADTRHTEAIKRLTTAFVKLLFPHATTTADLDPGEFDHYCLQPARRMREIVWQQLCRLDREYDDKPLPPHSLEL